MELVLIVMPFAASLITLLLWSAWRGREQAALWWLGSALALTVSAVVTTSGLRTALDLAPGGPLGPLAAWFLYRGSVAFVGATPSRWPAVLAIGGAVIWAGLHAARWSEAARYAGFVSEFPLCVLAAAVIARHSTTPIQRLLAIAIAVVAVVGALDPWLRDASGGSPPRAIVAWISVTFPTALLMACALLERGTLRATEKLRHREHQLAEAQRVAHFGSWSLDPERGELEWSDEKFRIHGHQPGSIDPWDALRAGLRTQKDRTIIESAAERALREGTPVETEFALTRADGKPARLRDHSVCVLAPDGRSRILGVTLDVTERRRAEAELARHRAHLEELVSERTAQLEASMRRVRTSERLASLGTLAAGIAHQINNPVASILASAQVARVLEGSPEAQGVAQKALRDIEREARRCGEIAHGVLRFASDRETEKRTQPIGPVLQRAVDATESYASSKGAEIRFDEPCADFHVEMSAIDIEQVVVNLLRNGVEAKEQGAAVRLSCVEKGEQVLIEVCDDGYGIPRAQLERVFDPFYTWGKNGGTGLGLSVAHGIATEHGGSLAIDSSERLGTRVVLALPLSVAAATRSPRSAS